MMIRFNPEMLILARDARGHSQEELARLLKVSQGTLSKIENGFLKVEEDLIEGISKVLNFPKSFFFREGRQFKANAHYYRKKIKIPRKELSRAEAIINIIKFNVEKLLVSIDIPEENLPKWDVEDKGSPSLYAQFIREYWRIPKGRVENLVKLVEDNGILVVLIDFGSSEFEGLSLYTENNQPVIFLNKNSSGDRMRLTLAHEVGHLGMHFSQIINNIRDVETEAFEFASELLVPSNEILPHLSSLNLRKLADLKRYWKVSMASILFKANKLNLIKNNAYRYLWTQFRKLNYHREEPIELSVPVEKPTLVKEIINAHLEELEYSVSDLLEVLCLNLKDFNEFFMSSNSRLRVIHKN